MITTNPFPLLQLVLRKFSECLGKSHSLRQGLRFSPSFHVSRKSNVPFSQQVRDDDLRGIHFLSDPYLGSREKRK
jgi:hypothetical protein